MGKKEAEANEKWKERVRNGKSKKEGGNGGVGKGR